MADLERIGIAIGECLLGEFDKLMARRGYNSRSETIRDLIRKEIVDEISGSPNTEVYGTVTYFTIIMPACYRRSSQSFNIDITMRSCRAN